MAAWSDRAEDLLFEGESIEDSVDVDTGRVVVTTHRVLVFTPEFGEKNYRHVDRPNVVGVKTDHTGRRTLLEYALKLGLGGALLVGIGLSVDFGNFVPTDTLPSTNSAMGIGSILGTVQSMMQLLAMLDEFMVMGGAMGVIAGTALGSVYVLTRTKLLVIECAGDDITMAAPDENAKRVVKRIDDAMEPSPSDDPPQRKAA
jgi:hypothetical protein